MKLVYILLALAAGAAAIEQDNQIIGRDNQTIGQDNQTWVYGSATAADWPAPEGLPTGWAAGANVDRAGTFGRVRSVRPTGRNLGRINIYYPERLGVNGLKHPIIFFKHGFTQTSSNFRGIIDRMVSHGFVVVADDQGGSSPLRMANDVEGTIIWFMQYTRQAAGLFNRNNVDVSRVGMAGHSMGAGATVIISNRFGKPDHPLARTEPDFYYRGGAPVQPYTDVFGGVSKDTLAPMMLIGGLFDFIVPTTMYRGIFRRSKDLKVMLEFPDGHGAPNGRAERYAAQVTDFMYAAILGDQSRWYTYFPTTKA